MADIAFLLLIFFLVTTTLDNEQGIMRLLPPPIPPDENLPEVKQRNVYIVLVNGNDDLLVESKPMEITELKDGAKRFLQADGVFSDRPIDEDLPMRRWVRKSDLEPRLKELQATLASAPEDKKGDVENAIKSVEKKLNAIELLKRDYKELPGSALISLQNDNGTSYSRYIEVQNELEAAVAELRNETAERYFGVTYDELEERVKSGDAVSKQEAKDMILAVRQVFPQRVSEAEPRQSVSYN